MRYCRSSHACTCSRGKHRTPARSLRRVRARQAAADRTVGSQGSDRTLRGDRAAVDQSLSSRPAALQARRCRRLRRASSSRIRFRVPRQSEATAASRSSRRRHPRRAESTPWRPPSTPRISTARRRVRTEGVHPCRAYPKVRLPLAVARRHQASGFPPLPVDLRRATR